MSYTTVAAVRENTTLIHDTFSNNTGTVLTFGDNYTFSIASVSKNGTPILTGFTFSPPVTLTLATGLVATDYIQVDRNILLSDAEITNIITEQEAILNGRLAKAYTLPFSSTPPLVASLSKLMCQAKVIEKLQTHSQYNPSKTEMAFAQKALDDIEVQFKNILGFTDHYRGTKVPPNIELVDASNVLITRKDGFNKVTLKAAIDDSTTSA